MGIIYEVNPPRIPRGSRPSESETDSLLSELKRRVSDISGVCDGIHVTESVLGTSRLSPVTTAGALKRLHPNLDITISMRVIDKDAAAVRRYVEDAVAARTDGILVLKGDPSEHGPADSGLVPSSVVSDLRAEYSDRTRLFLSIPSSPDFAKISRKTAARPAGFITQVIHSVRQVTRICGELNPMGFEVIPIVLLASEKNARSAEFLGLDWSGYRDRMREFICEVCEISGDVLITSPNDFGLARKVLGDLAANL